MKNGKDDKYTSGQELIHTGHQFSGKTSSRARTAVKKTSRVSHGIRKKQDGLIHTGEQNILEDLIKDT